MKRLALTLTFLATTLLALAQRDFRNGYVVTYDGDTLVGEIRNPASSRFQRCFFRSAPGEDVRVFTAAGAALYRVDDDTFVARRGQGESREPGFAQRLVAGPVSLYRDEEGFLAGKEEGPLYPLANQSTSIEKDGRRAIAESRRYVGVLAWLMSDCEGLRASIEQTGLYRNELTSLVERYNACRGSVSLKRNPVPAVAARIAISGGPAFPALDVDGTGSADALPAHFAASRAFATGLTVDLESPLVSQRLSLQTGVLFHAATFHSFRTFQRGHRIERQLGTADLRTLEFPLGIRYRFPTGGVTPYILSGIAFRYHPVRKLSWTRESESGGTVEITEGKVAGISPRQMAWWSGIGFSKKISRHYDLFLECRYSQTIQGSARRTSHALQPSIAGFQFYLGIRTR